MLELIFRAGGRVLTFSKEKRGKEREENKGRQRVKNRMISMLILFVERRQLPIY